MFASLLELSRNSTPFFILEFVFGVPLIIYLLWRVWEFTIVPRLHPDAPPELPYLIPYIGHGLEYVNNGQQLIDRAREYFGDTREPFALMCGGNKLYFLTNSSDVASMYKNTVTLDFSAIVRPLVTMFGMSEAGVDLASEVPPSADQDPVNNALDLSANRPKALKVHEHDFTHEHLLPGPKFAAMENAVAQSLRTSLLQNQDNPYYVQSESKGHTSVSLFDWTSFVLSVAIPDAIFGPKLARGNIALLKAFDSFSRYNWKLWYGWRDADNVRKAKEAYVSEIDKFLSLPLAEREPEESELWRKIERANVATGMTKHDISQRAGLLFWVSNSNPSRLSFWILNFLLFRPSLFDQVKIELQAAMPGPDAPLDFNKLANESPMLNAVIEETLRIVIEGASVRVVTDPAGLKIGGRVIPCGARLFAPPRQLHTNEKVWPDAQSFHPERWLVKDVVGKRENYKPFGGGVTLCPGRFLAKSTIRSFLAIALARFDIELEPAQVEAKFKLDEPVQGPVYPADGMDLKVRLIAKA